MLATVVELEETIGRDLTPSDYPKAERALKNATAVIEAATGQIEFRAGHVVTYPGNYTDRLTLAGPVSAITSIVLRDAAGVDSTIAGSSYFIQGSDVVLKTGASWGGPDARVTVTYDHGYAVIPDVVKAVCLMVAARALGNPEGLASESLGGYSRSFGEGQGLHLTDVERSMLAGAGFGTGFRSIPLRTGR